MAVTGDISRHASYVGVDSKRTTTTMTCTSPKGPCAMQTDSHICADHCSKLCRWASVGPCGYFGG